MQLIASYLLDLCKAYLFPDSPKYRSRILRERELIGERIAFYTPSPDIRHHGAIPPQKGGPL